MFTVAALYRFTPFDDPAALAPGIEAVARDGGVTGTLLLATEGLNGTVAGPGEGIAALLAHLRGLPGCADLEPKLSTATERPFARLKVRLKREIVTMGQPGVDPRAATGHYVSPSQWTEFIRDPEVAVIDTRNAYEVAIGTFEGAIDPGTDSFRDFPAWWAANRDRFHNRKIAMFCTGGIRCEKSTNWLLSQGVEEVYHLEGGILKYLEEVPEAESAWQGECFVFDGRVSVGHGLREGPHILCHACRRPIRPEDRQHPDYEEGVACHHCAAETSAEDKARFRERQRQIALARARGETHLAAEASED
ncbi:putative rhodanese-related sulfurtransferase [Roseivivax jejudonensis]|uniref:tRNA uridine(34) hydroxylase n=1 Tax=Roseivivax jejudonensis TaxID=1529041 RepID=A0A1X6YI89_9RHOB|nr:rhodanese-related sulfurtransferase [Roseivivax jejudonensis]SLN22153.1 putative rhodanese-related sulfurtransferase [Roseivivax jejudonensis]